ncbi:MAG: topoisomerase DNA-binding C4 zinc finger domain-containing protein [bacterium]|nr:topoisomerase DNA-binding C4 zinc finger domain-containing protein [bacterium]
MELRNGRFGPFLTSINYPESTFVLNLDKKGGVKYPSIPPVETELECPKCDAPLNLRRGKRGPWLGCSRFPKCRGRLGWNTLDDETKDDLEKQLAKHEKANPLPKITRFSNGEEIPEGTPVAELVVAGGVAELEVHPDVQTDGDVGIKASKRPLPPRPDGKESSAAPA